MLHAKFQDHRTSGSREEYFEGVLPYMGVAAILVMRPKCRKQTFVPLTHRGSSKNGFDWPSGFGEDV